MINMILPSILKTNTVGECNSAQSAVLGQYTEVLCHR